MLLFCIGFFVLRHNHRCCCQGWMIQQCQLLIGSFHFIFCRITSNVQYMIRITIMVTFINMTMNLLFFPPEFVVACCMICRNIIAIDLRRWFVSLLLQQRNHSSYRHSLSRVGVHFLSKKPFTTNELYINIYAIFSFIIVVLYPTRNKTPICTEQGCALQRTAITAYQCLWPLARVTTTKRSPKTPPCFR